MANNSATAVDATASSTDKEEKLFLIAAKVNLKTETGELKEACGYVMASHKFDAINMILAKYADKPEKVVCIPEIAEAKDIDFIINKPS